VGVSNVDSTSVLKSWKERFAEKSTAYVRETTMKESLSATQEAESQKLAQAIADASYDDILHIARSLVATDNDCLLGNTEFTVHAPATASWPNVAQLRAERGRQPRREVHGPVRQGD
jgi:hypothetical protein